VLAKQEAPGFLEPELLLELQWAHRRHRLEVVVKAAWVLGDGWIEIGRDDTSRSLVRALDLGGLVWEGATEYATVDEALVALGAGLAEWMEP
jgi:hypothetical protein